MSHIIKSIICLLLLSLLAQGQEIIPQLNQSNYAQYASDKWYLSMYQSPQSPLSQNSANFMDSGNIPGETPGIRLLSMGTFCVVYNSSQIPAGVYQMSSFVKAVYFGTGLAPTDAPIYFGIRDSKLNVIAEQKFSWGDGSKYQTSGIFSAKMMVKQSLSNALITFCKKPRLQFMSPDIMAFMAKFSLLFVQGLTGIPNCVDTKSVNGKMYCNACSPQYVIDSTKLCTRRIDYCSIYKFSACTLCVQGYFLQDNFCIKQSPQCQATDSQGLCIQCLAGFSVNQGLCVKDTVIITCPASQYKNFNGFCVDGSVQNCIKYLSPSGQCETCISGYAPNNQNQCVLTCPSPTQTQKFVLLNGVCVATDINCQEVNENGFCSVCLNGFYVSQGKCIQQSFSNGNDQITADESKNFYVQNSDGSRFYISGPWKNLQVWIDQSKYLYIKVANGGRQYLTGPYERLNAYQDTNGNWYIIDNNGKRSYILQSSNLRG